MRRIISAFFIAILVINLFYGCESNLESESTKKIKIGVCISDFNDKYWSYLIEEMKNYSKPLSDVEIVYVDARHDSNVQVSQVEDFIAQRMDVILVNLVDSASSKEITDKAKASKTPIISLNEPFINQDDSVSYIGSDQKELGVLEMEYLAKKMNFKGNVGIIIGKIGGEAQRLRTEAYHEVIAKYPDMEIVAEQTADWNIERGRALMQNWIEADKDIDVIVSNSDEMAIGALDAIEEAGKLEDIMVGGIDATPDALEYLKSGKLTVTVFQDAAKLSEYSIEAAIKVAKGKAIDKTIILQSELVTLEDAEKYIAKWKK